MRKRKISAPIIDDAQVVLMTHGEIKQMQEKIVYYTIPLCILNKIGQPLNFTDLLKSKFDISPTDKMSWDDVIALIKQRGTPEKAIKEQ